MAPTVLAFALAIGIFIGGKLHFNDSPEKLFSTNSKKDKLNRLIDIIDFEYVDEVNTDSIVDLTVNNILDKLDPHSVYIPKEEMEAVSQNMKGDFVGIGIRFNTFRDTVTVVKIIEEGPSAKAGLKAGDKILMADKDTLYGKKLSNQSLIELLRGKENTMVNLKIYRKSDQRTFTKRVTRGVVPLKSVEAQLMLTDQLGYVKINRFAESTSKEFSKALDELIEQGAQKLVLDLRGNPGGYLGTAEKVADEFLEDQKLIFFTKNKTGKISKVYATKEGHFENDAVYILIDEKSASASEIVAGALQDNDKGLIVGRRSFGKGLVQRERNLGDGSVVRITVARYYTPTGRSIQKPYNKGSEDYYLKFMERYHNGEMFSLDSIKVADSLKYKTPKGKVVYGGGGIIPDVFVPLNSLGEEQIYSLEDLGFFSDFVFRYLEIDRTRFQHYPIREFLTDFLVDDVLFEQFVDFLINRKVQVDYYAHKTLIKNLIKAEIANQNYNMQWGTKVKLDQDAMIQRVLELESKNKPKTTLQELKS